MKNLNVLKGAMRLSKSEMGHVTGGASYACECNDRSAVWTANYSSAKRAAFKAADWCGDVGGTCY